MKERSPTVKHAILDVVAYQLRDNNPPETRATYERLKKEGYSDESARALIGQVVLCEVFDVLKRGEPYNHERFVNRLEKLPAESLD
jgi:hypothetical protein